VWLVAETAAPRGTLHRLPLQLAADFFTENLQQPDVEEYAGRCEYLPLRYTSVVIK
jgi:hypothetical protein